MAGDQDTTFCDYCGEQQSIVETVPWQADVCAECGNDIEGESPENQN